VACGTELDCVSDFAARVSITPHVLGSTDLFFGLCRLSYQLALKEAHGAKVPQQLFTLICRADAQNMVDTQAR
jgi:hypothetical protein